MSVDRPEFKGSPFKITPDSSEFSTAADLANAILQVAEPESVSLECGEEYTLSDMDVNPLRTKIYQDGFATDSWVNPLGYEEFISGQKPSYRAELYVLFGDREFGTRKFSYSYMSNEDRNIEASELMRLRKAWFTFDG